MAKLGEIRKAKDCGKRGTDKYEWQACEGCGKERWVEIRRGQPISRRCARCVFHPRRGQTLEKRDGYALIRLKPNDFFYSMAQKGGCVLEHRLVMAKYLRRSLQPWEIVHHKNHNKDDNRIENLQLISDLGHKQLTSLENEIERLKIENSQLKLRIKELGSIIKQKLPAQMRS